MKADRHGKQTLARTPGGNGNFRQFKESASGLALSVVLTQKQGHSTIVLEVRYKTSSDSWLSVRFAFSKSVKGTADRPNIEKNTHDSNDSEMFWNELKFSSDEIVLESFSAPFVSCARLQHVRVNQATPSALPGCYARKQGASLHLAVRLALYHKLHIDPSRREQSKPKIQCKNMKRMIKKCLPNDFLAKQSRSFDCLRLQVASPKIRGSQP